MNMENFKKYITGIPQLVVFAISLILYLGFSLYCKFEVQWGHIILLLTLSTLASLFFELPRTINLSEINAEKKVDFKKIKSKVSNNKFFNINIQTKLRISNALILGMLLRRSNRKPRKIIHYFFNEGSSSQNIWNEVTKYEEIEDVLVSVDLINDSKDLYLMFNDKIISSPKEIFNINKITFELNNRIIFDDRSGCLVKIREYTKNFDNLYLVITGQNYLAVQLGYYFNSEYFLHKRIFCVMYNNITDCEYLEPILIKEKGEYID